MSGNVASLATGVDLGLLAAALLLGLRHGADWDHIAAITDITASQQTPRQGIRLGSIYAAGHAVVVFLLGVVAILLGERLPSWVDAAMGRVVGGTLILLGVYVAVSMIRQGRDFRLQSRWMLVVSGVRLAHRWILERLGRADGAVTTHEHPHVAVAAFHHEPDTEPASSTGTRVHTHRHHHALPSTYGTGTVLTVGALHGVGAETPTQVLVFLAAAGAGGPEAGVAVLSVFLLGLFIANTAITLGSAFGFLSATRHPRVYLGIGAVTAVVSLTVGALFLAGRESALPILLGG